MAMSREEILQRMVTGAEYIERQDITKSQRDKACGITNWRMS